MINCDSSHFYLLLKSTSNKRQGECSIKQFSVSIPEIFLWECFLKCKTNVFLPNFSLMDSIKNDQIQVEDNVFHVASTMVHKFSLSSLMLNDRESILGTVVDVDESNGKNFSSKKKLLLIRHWLKVLPMGSIDLMVKSMFVLELNKLNKDKIRKFYQDEHWICQPESFIVINLWIKTSIDEFERTFFLVFVSVDPRAWGTDVTRMNWRHPTPSGREMICWKIKEENYGRHDKTLMWKREKKRRRRARANDERSERGTLVLIDQNRKDDFVFAFASTSILLFFSIRIAQQF